MIEMTRMLAITALLFAAIDVEVLALGFAILAALLAAAALRRVQRVIEVLDLDLDRQRNDILNVRRRSVPDA